MGKEKKVNADDINLVFRHSPSMRKMLQDYVDDRKGLKPGKMPKKRPAGVQLTSERAKKTGL